MVENWKNCCAAEDDDQFRFEEVVVDYQAAAVSETCMTEWAGAG